jgi:hypothetical protein
MSLRELIIERILFCADEDELRDQYQMIGDLDCELSQLSDLDLFELYEEVVVG